MPITTILLIILVILLLGGFTGWGGGRGYGYGPWGFGVPGLLLVILVVYLLMNR